MMTAQQRRMLAKPAVIHLPSVALQLLAMLLVKEGCTNRLGQEDTQEEEPGI
jgi:hypothetical protein